MTTYLCIALSLSRSLALSSLRFLYLLLTISLTLSLLLTLLLTLQLILQLTLLYISLLSSPLQVHALCPPDIPNDAVDRLFRWVSK